MILCGYVVKSFHRIPAVQECDPPTCWGQAQRCVTGVTEAGYKINLCSQITTYIFVVK
jgi:hypothetical protein